MLDSAQPVGGSRRTIWHARPVSYYAWSGHEHHANSTETARAMAMLYALTGKFRCGRRQCAIPYSAGWADHRRELACGKAACSRNWICRTSARTCALEPRLRSGLLQSCSGRHALSRPRANRVRRQFAARSRRSGSRTCCAGRARFLRPRRSVHDADVGACGYRAACGVLLRTRISQDRIRNQRRSAIARSAKASHRRPTRRGTVRYRCRLRPCHASRPWRTFLERRC